VNNEKRKVNSVATWCFSLFTILFSLKKIVMAESILRNKSYQFAVQVVKLAQTLQDDSKEYVLSKQILRSGTAVGAIIREGEFAQSKADFINKMSQALKEANETDYWLDLLFETDYLNKEQKIALSTTCKELIAMLAASVKTAKNNLKK